MKYIFVYGTLKKGYHNHAIIENAKFIGEYKTSSRFTLHCNGSFPYMKRSDNGTFVHGEIYEVDDNHIRRMDRLEGHPTFYRREDIEIENFKEIVQSYIYQGNVERGCLECKDGKWPIRYQ